MIVTSDLVAVDQIPVHVVQLCVASPHVAPDNEMSCDM